jgi:hypothetical protein
LREGPSLDSKQNGKIIKAGDVFEECQQVRDSDQIFFLLADYSGWCFKRASNDAQVSHVLLFATILAQ